MKNALFVHNPHTGGNRLKNNFYTILQMLNEAGYEVTLHPTQGPGDARETAATRGCNYDLLICCGGDGTLNETIGGLVHCEEPPLLGYIPGGTTNDYATSLGLPKNNMLAAARRIVEPREIFRPDVGEFGDRTFNYVAAFGAFTDVAYSTNQNVKNTLGYLAYIFEILGRLTSLPSIVASVECDGERLEGEFVFGMITNSSSIGGLAFKNKAIKLDDGQLEMLLVRQPRGLAEFSSLSGALVRRDIHSPYIELRQGRHFQITSQQPLSWTLDGEFGGETTTCEIGVLPKAVSICI